MYGQFVRVSVGARRKCPWGTNGIANRERRLCASAPLLWLILEERWGIINKMGHLLFFEKDE